MIKKFSIALAIAILSIASVPLKAQELMKTMNVANPDFYSLQRIFNANKEAKLKQLKNWETKRYYRWQWFWQSRVDATGSFAAAGKAMAAHAKNLKTKTNTSPPAEGIKNLNNYTPQTRGLKSVSYNWRSDGPHNFGYNTAHGGAQGTGRVECLWSDPNDPTFLYAGSTTGGLFYTDNSGSDWHPLTDDEPVFGVSDVVADPDDRDHIYVASGIHTNGLLTSHYGRGVLESTNGGQDWTVSLGFAEEDLIYPTQIVMAPSQSDRLYVSTEFCLYRKLNSSSTWQKTWEDASRSVIIRKIVVHPTNPDIAYASGDNILLYTSNGGNDWIDIIGSVSWTQGNTIRYLPTDCRIAIATCSSQPDDLYLLSYDKSATTEVLLHSTNQGGNWTSISSQNFSGASYILFLAVSHQGDIYAGGVRLHHSFSTNQSNFTQQSDIHADIRDIAFPGGPLIFLAHDGGVSIPNQNTADRWLNRCNGLAVNQFYGLDAAELDPQFWLGGTHDCGSYRHTSASGWESVYGGDGGNAAIDHVNNNNCYGISNSWLIESADKAASFSTHSSGIGKYDIPLQFRPDNNSIFYRGNWNIERSTGGSSFVGIAPDNANGQPISAMKVSESNPDYLYYAMTWEFPKKPSLWRTTNNTPTARPFSVTNIGINNSQLQSALNEAMVTDIEVHPDDPETLWISIGNFSHGNKVFYSTTGGNSWTNISNGLPEIPVQSIAYDNNTGVLFAGTDAGLYYRLPDESYWQLSEDLPLVIISDIRINYSSNRIIAATYGRGIWSADLICPDANSGLINIQRTSYPTNTLCKGMTNTLKATYTGNCDYSEFAWSIPLSCRLVSTYGTKKQYARVSVPDNYNTETIKAALRMNCGLSSYKSQSFAKTYCGSRYIYKYSPNPADSYLDVSRAAIKADEKDDPVEIQKQLDREKYYEIILYNKDQKPEFRQKTSNPQVRINTSRLEPGIYYLHIIVNGETIMKEQIVIK